MSSPSTSIDLESVLKLSDCFFERHPAPVSTNRLRSLLNLPQDDPTHLTPTAASQMLSSSHTLVHSSITTRLLPLFIAHKILYGSSLERSLYTSLTPTTLLHRLIQSRPLAFYGRSDKTRLRNGLIPKKPASQWLNVGTDHQSKDIRLDQYLSYHEMQLSALIGASVPTHFINAGDRKNHGIVGEPGSFTPSGIYVGLVGPRFNGLNTVMESEYLLITRGFSTPENGFGSSPRNPSAASRLNILADLFIGDGYTPGSPPPPLDTPPTSFFPSFDEVEVFCAQNPTSEKYFKVSNDQYINIDAYMRRIAITAETLLLDANNRASNPSHLGVTSKTPTLARVIVVGFGLGVWKRHEIQSLYFMRAFSTVLRVTPLPYIGEVVFSYIDATDDLYDGCVVPNVAGNDIRIEVSCGCPADVIDEGRLLVASYAWDGNSYPGNEYWFGQKSGSGDSAAACCSLIGELMNPEVNPKIVENVSIVG